MMFEYTSQLNESRTRDSHIPLYDAQYSTHDPYHTAASAATAAPPTLAVLFPNLSSNRKKSSIRATPGAACSERSRLRGMRMRSGTEEEEVGPNSPGSGARRIREGKRRRRVQYMLEITVASYKTGRGLMCIVLR